MESTSEKKLSIKKVIIIPGNGCFDADTINWYGWFRDELEKNKKNKQKKNNTYEVILPKCMPDPYDAKEKVWIPFIRDELKADENTLLIGHSSGAEAAMRLLETDKLAGIILVSACYTDLGIESEKISGYYDRPWLWEKM